MFDRYSVVLLKFPILPITSSIFSLPFLFFLPFFSLFTSHLLKSIPKELEIILLENTELLSTFPLLFSSFFMPFFSLFTSYELKSIPKELEIILMVNTEILSLSTFPPCFPLFYAYFLPSYISSIEKHPKRARNHTHGEYGNLYPLFPPVFPFFIPFFSLFTSYQLKKCEKSNSGT